MVKGHYWDDTDYPMPKEYDPAWAQLDPNNITSADMYRKCLVAQIMQQKTSFSLSTQPRPVRRKALQRSTQVPGRSCLGRSGHRR